jgi:hypothetical protein
LLGSLCQWAPLTIRKPTGKQSAWTNAWRNFCVALCIPVHLSGSIGFPSRSTGIIPAIIQQWTGPLLRSYMGKL